MYFNFEKIMKISYFVGIIGIFGCNENEIGFNGTCINCSGPTSLIDFTGECKCAPIHGMIMNDENCECEKSDNFEWSSKKQKCVCREGTKVENI